MVYSAAKLSIVHLDEVPAATFHLHDQQTYT